MKTAAALALALCACGGAISAADDAGQAPDAQAEAASVPEASVEAAPADDAAPDAVPPCLYAAGCCAALGDRMCAGDASFGCAAVDDAGTLGWVATDGGACP